MNDQTNQEFQRDMDALWNQPELIEKKPIKAQSGYKRPKKRIPIKHAIKAYKTKNNAKK
jgi:alpha-mannosidase